MKYIVLIGISDKNHFIFFINLLYVVHGNCIAYDSLSISYKEELNFLILKNTENRLNEKRDPIFKNCRNH